MNPFKPRKNGPAIVRGMNPRDYHGADQPAKGSPDFVMSRSELSRFAQCPRKWLAGQPEKKTDAMEWGSLIDCLALTPQFFEEAYAVAPGEYPDEKGNLKPWNYNAGFCKAWRAEQEQAGRETIKGPQLAAAKAAVFRLDSDPVIAGFLGEADKQVAVFAEYHDAETGVVVPVKALVDLVGGPTWANCLGDLKTADNAHPDAWQRAVTNHGYHYQAAMYLDMWNAVTGENRDQFVHVISESEPPYEPARRILSSEFLELGRVAYRRDFQFYAQCMKSRFFPGYDDASGETDNSWIVDGFRITVPPPWMMRDAA